MEKKTVLCPKCGHELYRHDGRSTIVKLVTCKRCYIQWRIDVISGEVTRAKHWDKRKENHSSGRVLS